MKKHRIVHRFSTDQGLEVRVYRLHPEDADLLIGLFEHMSPQSRYLRFNEFLDHPDADYVRRRAEALAEVDPRLGAAWVALADLPGEPNAPVAGARFVRSGKRGVAEVSVAVRDDMQHQGIGSHLLVFAAKRAKESGIHTLAASFHTSNRAIWALLAGAPFQVKTEIRGPETDALVDLDSATLEEIHEVLLAQASGR